jgi:CHASE3 domain sensor protein
VVGVPSGPGSVGGGGRRWFADRSIGQKLSVGFGSIVVLTGVVIAVGLIASGRATSSIDRTTEVQAPTSLAASDAQAALLRMIGDVRGYLALGDAAYRSDYEAARGDFETALAELDRLAVAADPTAPTTVVLTGRLADLRAAYSQWTPQPAALFDLHDDQLQREPALKILIEDATPRVQRVLVALAAALKTQAENPPNAADVATLSDMADFQSSFLSMLAGLRGYVTTGRDIFKFEYTSNETINTTALDRLMAVRDRLQPIQRDQLDAIVADRAEFLKSVPTMFAIVAGPNARADLASFRDQAVPVGDRMLSSLERLAAEEQANLRSDLGRGRADLSNAQTQALVGGLGAFLLAVVLAFVFRRAIAGPIVRLTRVSETIGEGDLTARATVETGDEIGTLATTFNTMTARLETTVGQLNDRNREQAEYIEQVGHVTSAAVAVEADTFEPGVLDGVSGRDDALGQLARTFQRMAREVRAREARLREQVHELRIEIDEARQAKKVAEITDTDFFRDLRTRAAGLRQIVDDKPSEPEIPGTDD